MDLALAPTRCTAKCRPSCTRRNDLPHPSYSGRCFNRRESGEGAGAVLMVLAMATLYQALEHQERRAAAVRIQTNFRGWKGRMLVALPTPLPPEQLATVIFVFVLILVLCVNLCLVLQPPLLKWRVASSIAAPPDSLPHRATRDRQQNCKGMSGFLVRLSCSKTAPFPFHQGDARTQERQIARANQVPSITWAILEQDGPDHLDCDAIDTMRFHEHHIMTKWL